MSQGTRQDTWAISVSIDGNNFGIWDKKTGGAVDSDENKYNPGAMGPPISLGGRKTVDNVTLQRLYMLGRDLEQAQTLINRAGRAKVVISQQALDQDGNAYGVPIVYRGTLKRYAPPEVDSESSSPAMAEIEVTIEGYPVAS